MTASNSPSTVFDPVEFKKQFPIFKHPENQSLVYLDNAATTQKPQCVIDAIVDFYSRVNANANRSSHRLGRAATAIVNDAREKAAQFVNANQADEIVFTSGATESINILTNGLAERIHHGDEIILSLAEHHANLVPWQELCKRRGAKLIFAQVNCSDLKHLITQKTKLISVTLASNALGSITDPSVIKNIRNKNPNIIYIADASQLVPHRSIDVDAIACDFLFFSAHKIYGPSGLGVLYGTIAMLEKLPPLSFGGEMISRVERSSSTYVQGPERFEAGTSPLSALSGFVACLSFWADQDRYEMERYEENLTAYLHSQLEKICLVYPDIFLLTKSENNIGIATLASKIYSVADMAIWLDQNDIAVRAGDHCAQLLWRSMAIDGALRISLAAYNTHSDVDCFVENLSSFLEDTNKNETEEKKIACPTSGINELMAISNWKKKYKKIIFLGKQYIPMKNIQREENLISGCESKLWFLAIQKEGCWHFFIDSDSLIIKGLAFIVISEVNGKEGAEIKAFDFFKLFEELGLDKHLSQSRLNGLLVFIDKLKSSVG
ncbi:MAG: aminotransferase class V-fold PLP-dependent enzyme [Cellvibrionaceae bacterium]